MAASFTKPRWWWTTLLGATLVATLLALAPATPARVTSAHPLLEERAKHEQRVDELLDRGFVALVRCREDCLLSGRVAIRARARKWTDVGRFASLRLRGGTWHELTVPLTERGRELARRSGRKVNVRARTTAISLESPTYGDTDSKQTLER
jgi:hypothetical protein